MFSIKGASNIEQEKILRSWMEDNFADGSVRVVFTEENHALIIDQTEKSIPGLRLFKPVEIREERVIDYKADHYSRMEELNDLVEKAITRREQIEKELSRLRLYGNNDYILSESFNMKFDESFQADEEFCRLVDERFNLRTEYLRKTQWDYYLCNDNWIPMEQPRQLSTEYFDNLDIKEVVLYYQLDEEAVQDILTEDSYAEQMKQGLPSRFYLGKINGKNELIFAEDVFDHECYYFSHEATEQYEISVFTLGEIARCIYAYQDRVSLTVDEQHLNHEPIVKTRLERAIGQLQGELGCIELDRSNGEFIGANVEKTEEAMKLAITVMKEKCRELERKNRRQEKRRSCAR